jgi:hypothetical protein
MFSRTKVACGPDSNGTIEQSECVHCGWLARGTRASLLIAEGAHICFATLLRKAALAEKKMKLSLQKVS